MPRQPAPESLRIVEEFVNTIDLESGRDQIETVSGLRSWLADHGLRGAIAATDVDRASGAREGMRALLEEHSGFPPDRRRVELLDQVLASSQVTLRVVDGVPTVTSGGGLDAALAGMVAAILQARADGSWVRLKACREHGCRWAFFDHSKNRSSTWCDMAVCGSRSKVRAYRARRAGA
jgi:predicted RNA-binding Zn ribbon-like protein